MRVIDADVLIAMNNAEIKEERNHKVAPVSWAYARECFNDDIDSVPTIDAEPVRHGHWIKETDGGTRCSCCKQTVKEDSTGVAVPVDLSDMPYCPKCGAIMDEVEK